jgi:hypothetical protein
MGRCSEMRPVLGVSLEGPQLGARQGKYKEGKLPTTRFELLVGCVTIFGGCRLHPQPPRIVPVVGCHRSVAPTLECRSVQNQT